MSLALLYRNSQKRWLRLRAGQSKGYVSCPRPTPQTKWQQNIHSEGSRIRQVQTGPRGKSKSSSRKGHEKGPNATKHLPFKMKSSYGKIVFVANKIQSHRQNSRPVLSSLPIQHNRAATPASHTVVHHFHGCQVTINYRAGVGVFQQSSNL